MANWEIVQPQQHTTPPHTEPHISEGWSVEAPPPAPEPSLLTGKEAIRHDLESAHSRFRDFLTVLTEYQWAAAGKVIARALVDLEDRAQLVLMARQQRNARNGFDRKLAAAGQTLNATIAGMGLSKATAVARFEAAHAVLLRLLELTPEAELARKSRRFDEERSVEDEFRAAAGATISWLDEVNRRLAGR
jgi:hypothetical protein